MTDKQSDFPSLKCVMTEFVKIVHLKDFDDKQSDFPSLKSAMTEFEKIVHFERFLNHLYHQCRTLFERP